MPESAVQRALVWAALSAGIGSLALALFIDPAAVVPLFGWNAVGSACVGFVVSVAVLIIILLPYPGPAVGGEKR